MNKKITFQEKIFVAGGSGMVGRAVIKKLLEKGYGNINLGGKIFFPNRTELNLMNNHDVNDWFAINKPSVVIIAAAKVGGIGANAKYPYDFLLENLKIQNNLIELSFKHKVKRLLFLGSSCIYPKFANQPIVEESLLEGFLEKTNESYAIAKIAGIKLCESLNIQYGFDAISLMPTNLYGPGDNYHPQNSHVMASLIKKFSEAKKTDKKRVTCWGTGTPLREFMHVYDLAEAIIYCLEFWSPLEPNAPRDKNNNPLYILNVGTGKDISIKELANKISNIIDYKGDIVWDESKPDGTPKKQLDVTRINNLGWSANINLEEGILKTITHFNKYYI